MRQSSRATGTHSRLHAFRTGNSGSRKTLPLSGQKTNGKDPEGVLPQRADAGDSEGARREGRIQERDPGVGRQAQAEKDACRGSRKMRARNKETQNDVADVG